MLACERAWEVDFDIRRDRHAAQSVAFLRSQGFDINAARAASTRRRSGRSSPRSYRRCRTGAGTSSWRDWRAALRGARDLELTRLQLWPGL